MYKYLFAVIAIIFSFNANAQMQFNQDENNPINQYIAQDPDNRNKSIIYVFYNSQDCDNCSVAMRLIDNLYNIKFDHKYSLFFIDYYKDQEADFIQRYNLNAPLEVVLVKINDGASFGYKKVSNLQNMTSDVNSFDQYLDYQINSFLGNNY